MTVAVHCGKKWSTVAICLGTMLLVLSELGIVNVNGASRAPSRVTQLRQQRLALLEEILKAVEQRHKLGELGHVDELYQARQEVLDARLDLAETLQDRIEIHEQLVALATDYHKRKSALENFGDATTNEVLKAKVQLLERQIALEQAKERLEKATE